MLKKLLTLSLILALALCLLPASAAAATPSKEDIWDAFYRETDSLDIRADNGLPYVSFVDIDGDGVEEWIYDENWGDRAVEFVHDRHLEQIGSHINLVYGDVTVVFWNRSKGRAEHIRMENDRMYVAFNAQHHVLITCSSDGDAYTYHVLRITDKGAKLTNYTERYSPQGMVSCSVDGKAVEYYEIAYELESYLTNAMAIGFSMYS